jgi:hypothetical protein
VCILFSRRNYPTSFLECHFAWFILTAVLILTAVHIAFNIKKHVSVLHVFTDWSSTGGPK